jgi:hypothetical protein
MLPGMDRARCPLPDETRLVATARPGNPRRYAQPRRLQPGQLTVAGLLPPLAVMTTLASAAARAGLPADEARGTIGSGLAADASHPRKLSRSRTAGTCAIRSSGQDQGRPSRWTDITYRARWITSMHAQAERIERGVLACL